MIDPKYIDLPGIAYDQPDIYETTDILQCNEQFFYATSEDSEAVENLNVSSKDAYEKFKHKKLNSIGVDFSDELSVRPKHGYNTGYENVELISEPLEETYLQKYQRLSKEVQELLDDLSKIEKGRVKFDQHPVDLYQEVQQLQKQLIEIKLQTLIGSDIFGTVTNEDKQLQRHLSSQLEISKNSEKAKSVNTETVNSQITYNLHYKPEHAKLEQIGKIAQLEQRLNKLEKILGNSDDSLTILSADTNHKSLMGAVSVLSAKLALLDSSQLEQIEGRLQILHTRLQQINESRQSVEESDKGPKLLEMYAMLNNCMEMCNSLPVITDRLITLQNLHEQAAQFSKALKQTDLTQQELQIMLKDNQILLQTVESSLQDNVQIMKQNLNELA